MPPLLVPVCSTLASSHQLQPGASPPPLIPITELHSTACSSYAPPPCSFSDSSVSSPPSDIQWWLLPGIHENAPTTQNSILLQPQQHSFPHSLPPAAAGPSSWSAPPLLVAGPPKIFRPLSPPMFPSCMLCAPPSGALRDPVGQLELSHFDAVPQQRRNCVSGATSTLKATNPDGSPRRRQHVCHYPSCSKVYTTATHLQDHLLVHARDQLYKCPLPNCGRHF